MAKEKRDMENDTVYSSEAAGICSANCPAKVSTHV